MEHPPRFKLGELYEIKKDVLLFLMNVNRYMILRPGQFIIFLAIGHDPNDKEDLWITFLTEGKINVLQWCGSYNADIASINEIFGSVS